MPKKKKVEAKTKPKKLSRMLESGKKTRAKAAVEAFAKTDAKTKTKTKASLAKPVVLKLPRTLKKAARTCAKAQGLKLRAWIVESIKTQIAQESTSLPAKSLQTL